MKADEPQAVSPKQVFWQPYAQFIPAEGQIVVLFGNWYTDLLNSAMRVSDPINEAQFNEYLKEMQDFEQDLKNNHVDVVKVWFNLSWKDLQKRLKAMDPSETQWHQMQGVDWRNRKQYENLQRLRQRFTEDWFVIDSKNEKWRDQQLDRKSVV